MFNLFGLFVASPVSIPPRSCAIHRPMRSSVEGLNQEIEKLVLVPGQPHSCRPESSHVNPFCIHMHFTQIVADIFGFFFFGLVYSSNTRRSSSAIS